MAHIRMGANDDHTLTIRAQLEEKRKQEEAEKMQKKNM